MNWLKRSEAVRFVSEGAKAAFFAENHSPHLSILDVCAYAHECFGELYYENKNITHR